MMITNALKTLFSASRPRRRTSYGYSSESLEQRVVLSAVTGTVTVDAPAESETPVTEEDVTPQGWALGDLNVQSNTSTDAGDYQLRGFAIADLGVAGESQTPVLRGLSSSPLGLTLGGQEGSPVTSDESSPQDDLVLKGLASIPLGLRGLADSPLSARQEGQEVASDESTDDSNSEDPTVLRGLVGSPIGARPWGLPGDTPFAQSGPEATTDDTASIQSVGSTASDGIFSSDNAAVDAIFTDGFESGDVSSWAASGTR